MAQIPNPPDRDDAVTERAVPMVDRPAGRAVGAGRAINAAFERRRPSGGDAEPRHGGQETSIQGPGYPTRDRDDADPRDGDDADDGDGQPGSGDDRLEALLVPPGGDDLGGDRDTDPNLNGGHGIGGMAPEEGDRPIEEEGAEDSLVGHGHEDKAAWNRERVAHLQELEDDTPDPATSEAMGAGGAVLAGALPGWEGGSASPTVDQEFDPSLDHELSESEEIVGDMAFGDAGDVMDDESVNPSDGSPDLPEDHEIPNSEVPLEERLIASDGEDPLVAGAEFGTDEDLDMEDLNEIDDIEQAFEDGRDAMDDAMDGNERRGA